VHSGYVESECCHFLFYGVIGMEVVCCICAGRFSIYVHFKLFVFTCYCQVKKVYGFMLFICGVECYVATYIIYVCVDGM
jgi:hypothetical protein